MDQKRLDKIKARERAATKRPWRDGTHVGEPKAICAAEKPAESLLMLDRGMAIFERAEDAAFTVHARDDVPDLVAEVEGVRNAGGPELVPLHSDEHGQSCLGCRIGFALVEYERTGAELRQAAERAVSFADNAEDTDDVLRAIDMVRVAIGASATSAVSEARRPGAVCGVVDCASIVEADAPTVTLTDGTKFPLCRYCAEERITWPRWKPYENMTPITRPCPHCRARIACGARCPCIDSEHPLLIGERDLLKSLDKYLVETFPTQVRGDEHPCNTAIRLLTDGENARRLATVALLSHIPANLLGPKAPTRDELSGGVTVLLDGIKKAVRALRASEPKSAATDSFEKSLPDDEKDGDVQ